MPYERFNAFIRIVFDDRDQFLDSRKPSAATMPPRCRKHATDQKIAPKSACLTTVALTNKMARGVWVVMTRRTVYMNAIE